MTGLTLELGAPAVRFGVPLIRINFDYKAGESLFGVHDGHRGDYQRHPSTRVDGH